MKTTISIEDAIKYGPQTESKFQRWLTMKWMRLQEKIHGKDYWLD